MEIHLPVRNTSKSSLNYRETFKKEALERKKNILHLILKYLFDNNLNSVAEVLQNQTQVGFQYQVCENVDLDIILQEYQSYYQTKFQKQPIILRKNENDPSWLKKEKKKSPIQEKKEDEVQPFEIEIHALSNQGDDCRHLKPLSEFEHFSSEWKELAEQILRQIVPKNLGITFNECISLEKTVETLKEAVVYPVLYPKLFEKVISWKGVLLYGPPGTGKTLVAKALASESCALVINITSSSIISKWRGESEKLLKVLFDVAKFYSPTIIFMDEIDALASSQDGSTHEASRRFKSELLIHIDGIIKNENVYILATTNSPWNLDAALLRRFDKRILVPLPDRTARGNILDFYFTKYGHVFKKENLTNFVNMTEYFSGSDIKVLCTEVEMMRIRERIVDMKSGKSSIKKELRPVKPNDVIMALNKIKPCVDSTQYKKYLEWELKYGLN